MAAATPAPGSDLLDPVDLRERVRLAQGALIGCLDASREYLPYWNCDIADGNLTVLKHAPYDGEAVWDRLHNAGRALHGLTLTEAVTGERVDPAIIAALSGFLLGLFGPGDGLPSDAAGPSGRRVCSLHNVREGLNGLTALLKRGDDRAVTPARQLVRTLRRSLDDEGRLHRDRLPDYVGAYTHQPHMEGRTLDALVRYGRVSKDEFALDVARLIAGFALRHCFTESGDLTDAAGTHGHSINVLVTGLIDLALETGDAALLAGARRAFDVGLARFNSSFGWSMEGLHRRVLRGEANNTGDLLRGALLLGHAVGPEYFGRSERILRGHLLPSQLRHVAGLANDPEAPEDQRRRLADRVRGGFGIPTPNDLQVEDTAPLCIYDITSGAADALSAAWQAALEVSAATVRVNLLFDVERDGVHVRSGLSGTGRIEVTDDRGRDLFLRLPPWVVADSVKASTNGDAIVPTVANGYLHVPGTGMARRVTFEFPVRQERTVEVMVGQPFTIDWRGDQIVAMSPPENPNPDGAPIPPARFPMFPRCV
ncbi:MAG: hypothetical protein KF897_06710 [Opitutaceae bacterium]|nr:hypothetical protein [Opitutaceae bacterium]